MLMQGVDQIPSGVQAEIESWTPAPTPDPSSTIMSKVDKVAGALDKLTGVTPSPEGFNGVSLSFLGFVFCSFEL